MKKITVILTLTCFLFPMEIDAQSLLIDSLKKEWKSADRSLRVNISNQLSKAYFDTSADTAKYYADQALSISNNLNDLNGQGNALLNIGYFHEVKGALDTAVTYYHQALNIFETEKIEGGIARTYLFLGAYHLRRARAAKAEEYFLKALEIYTRLDMVEGKYSAYNNLGALSTHRGNKNQALQYYFLALGLSEQSGHNDMISRHLFNIGITYERLGDYENSLTYLFKSLKIKDQLKDLPGQASVFNSLGIVSEQQGHNDKALEYYRKCLSIFQQIDNPRDQADVNNNIGIVHLNEHNYDSALVYLQRSLSIYQDLQLNEMMARSLGNLGEVYLESGDLVTALDYFKQSLDRSEDNPNKNQLAYAHQRIGNAYTHLEDFIKAEEHLLKSLDLRKQANSSVNIRNTYQDLSFLYESLGDYRRSLEYHKLYTHIKDSLFNETKSEQLASLQTQFETERKERELAAQKQQLEALQTRRKLDVLLILVIAISIYMIQRQRSKRKQLELKVQQTLNQQLQQVNDMKSRFFANISHEFRTPLSLILGPVETMIENANEEGKRVQLQLIQRNASRLLKLINQMLDLSRLEAGKMELQTAPRNIITFLKGQLYTFHSLAEKRHIKVNFHCKEEELVVYFEPEKMEQVIANLLSNAFKFTEDHGTLTMSVERTTSEVAEGVVISISDTGKGISAEELPYVFDRFYQASFSADEDSPGTGIGLALVKELVELHRGTVEVFSERGKGSTFKIHLPMGRSHLKDEQINVITAYDPAVVPLKPEQVNKSVAQEEERETSGKPLLLIVEDNADLRHYIADAFNNRFTIEIAEHGLIGWEKATETVPDIIISDVMMPKLNGIDLCRRLKNDQRTSHIPIILLTAKVTQEDRLKGLANEADDYLEKPFSTKELAARINNLINTRKKLQDKFQAGMMFRTRPVEVSSMEEVFLEKLMSFLEENIEDENLTVEQVSEELNMSRVHLHRKLQALTKMSPSQFIRRFRLQKAMALLEKNAGTVSEIAYLVGFASATYFSKCFNDEFGYSPKEVKTRSMK